MKDNLRLKIEEQVNTLFLLENTKKFHYLFMERDTKTSSILEDLEKELQWNIVHEMACIDVMFRLLSNTDLVLKHYGYERFELDLNKSALGYACPVGYFQVWELYGMVYKAKIRPVYEDVVAVLQDLALEMNQNPNDVSLHDGIARLQGFADVEDMVVNRYFNRKQ